MPESTIVAAIQRYLKRAYGPRQWNIKVHGNGFMRSGIPDILACIDGRFYAFEVKQPGKDATRLQKYEIARLTDAGATAAVVTSVEDVAEVLREAWRQQIASGAEEGVGTWQQSGFAMDVANESQRSGTVTNGASPGSGSSAVMTTAFRTRAPEDASRRSPRTRRRRRWCCRGDRPSSAQIGAGHR